MRIIKRLKMTQHKFTGTKEYDLYVYEVEDDLGNLEDIDSLQKFKVGDRVEVWFDTQYNKPKMRIYKEKRK